MSEKVLGVKRKGWANYQNVPVVSLELLESRLAFHRKHFNRYTKEVETEVKKKSKDTAQLVYSYNQMQETLSICDELEFIIKTAKKAGG